MIQDITQQIIAKQCAEDFLPDFRREVSQKNDDERFPFNMKSPIVVVAVKPNLIGYDFFAFLSSEDQRYKAVFWKKTSQNIVKGFAKDLQTDKIQYFENKKLLNVYEMPKPKIQQIVKQKVAEFKRFYQNKRIPFVTYARRDFVQKANA